MPIRELAVPPRHRLLAALVAVGCGLVVFAQPPAPFQPTVVLKGHTDPIYAVAVSPDGRHAATGSFDKTIKLWDLASGKEIRVLAGKNGHQNQVLCVAYSPDGATIASGGSDNAVKVWDLPPVKPATVFEHADQVTRVAVSPDGKTVASGAANGTVRLWATADGKAGPTLSAHAGPVVGLGFAPNNQVLVSLGADRTLRYWNPANGQETAAIGVSTAGATGLAVNPGNGSVCTASADGVLRFWPAQLQMPKALPAVGTGSTALALSADGNFLVTAIDDKSVRVVNVASSQQAHVFSGLPSAAKSVAVAANGQLYLAGTDDGNVHVWGSDGKSRGAFTAHDGAVTAVALLNQTPVTAGADGVVRTWGAIPSTPKPIAHPDTITALTALADGKGFATGSADKIVRLVRSNAVEKQLTGHLAAVTAIAQGGGNLISGDSAGGLFAWDLAGGQKTAITPPGPKVAVSAIVPQSGTTGFAVVYADGLVQYRPVVTAKEKEKAHEPKPLAHPAPVLAAAFTSDGKNLVTVCADRSLRTWSVESGKSEAPLPLGSIAVRAAAFTNDRSKVLLALDAGNSTKLVLTTPASGAKPALEFAVSGRVEAVAVSPDASRFACAVVVGDKRSVRIVDSGGRVLESVATPPGPVVGLRLLADNKTVAFGDGKQLVQHESAVTSALDAGAGNTAALAVLPNGQFLTGGSDKLVRLWDPAGRKELRKFGPLSSAVTAMAVSPDGQGLAAGSGKEIKAWAVGDGKELASIVMPADVRAIAFNPDRSKLLAGLADGTAIVHDLATGRAAQAAKLPGGIAGVAFHPSQPIFFLAGAGKGVAVLPLALVRQVADPAAVGSALAVTPSGSHVLSAGKGNGVTIWNAGSGAKERTLDAAAPITAIAVSKNGQLVAVAHGTEPQVTLLQFNDGAVIGRFKTGSKVSDLVFHPTNPTLVGALPDRAVAWSVAFDAGQPVPPEFGKQVQEFPPSSPVAGVSVLPDGSAVVTGAGDKLTRLWKVPSDQPKTLAHPNLVDSVAWDRTGRLLATGCHDGKLRVWDVAKGEATKTIDAHLQPTANPIYAVAWTPDGKQVATASFDRTIKLWDADSGKLVREFRAGTEKAPVDPKYGKPAPAVLGSSGGGWLNAPPEPGHRDQVFTLSFTKDGKFLASGSSDRTVKLWETATGRVVREFPNPTIKAPPAGQPHPSHPGFVHMVKFTPDGSRVVSAGTAPRGQGYLAVWSAADGRLLAAKELPVGPIYSFDLTPTGALLGCGPKQRFQSESEALLVPLPLK